MRRRGLTFIETVCAVTILGLIAGAVTSAVSFVIESQRRQHLQLTAVEVCNRLIVQYLDDPESMPSPNTPMGPFGGYRWRWEKVEEPARVTPVVEVRRENSNSSIDLNRMRVIRLRVWLAEDSGGSIGFDPDLPGASLVRMYDPLAVTSRNPDSIENMLRSPDGRARLTDLIRRGGIAP